MATPHVSAVAALVWSANPLWTNVEIRNALDASAQDLSAAERCLLWLWLVQARAPLTYPEYDGTTPPDNTAPALTISSPANNSSFAFGDAITFTASCLITEDGSLNFILETKRCYPFIQAQAL